MGYTPLSHSNHPARQKPDAEPVFDTSLDATYASEAEAFLAARPQLQIVSEFIKILRGDSDPQYQETVTAARKNGAPTPPYLSWWSLHGRYDHYTVLDWFKQRADIRQGILTAMCNFPAKAARMMEPSAQANLIEMVIESNDRTSADFDAAVRPEDAVVYGPADDIFRQFAQSLPKEKDGDAEQQKRVLRVLAESFMLFVDGIRTGSEHLLTPIMTPIDLRMILGFDEWHRYLPQSVLARIDRERVLEEKKRQEKRLPEAPFTTRMELQEVGMLTIVESFPFSLIRKVFDVAANRRLKFDKMPAATPAVQIPAAAQPLRVPSVQRPRLPLPEAVRSTAIEVRHREPSQPAIVLPAPAPPPEQAVASPPAETAAAPPGPQPEQPPAATPEGPQAADVRPTETVLTPPEPPFEGPPAPIETAQAPEEPPRPSTASQANVVPAEVDAGWEDPRSPKPGPLPAVRPAPDSERPITVEPEPPSELPPPGAFDEKTSIAPLGEIMRDTNYIPDGAFDAVRDGPLDPTLPPAPPARSGSSSSIRIMQRLLEFRTRYGLRLPDNGENLPVGIVNDMYAVLNDLSWITDEQRMREVIINTLNGLDPDEFDPTGSWTYLHFTPLCTMFFAALRASSVPLLKEAGHALERSRDAHSASGT